MTMVQPAPAVAAAIPRNYAKWAVFAVWALLILGVIWTDERFLVDSKDEEWAHIAPFQWWLLVHGLAGLAALLIGPLQFSERLRRTHVKLHRVLGRVYIGAICIAAPMAIYIGDNWETNVHSAMEGWAQGGGWLLCAVLAFVFAVKRNIPRHRQWVARSYGFTFVFIMARAPHLVSWHWKTNDDFVTYRWFLVFAALIVPDLILQWDELTKRRKLRAVA
ncbi:MAG TPA: DUF2306 domain-containing protein [Alphaproteobacteria bacterium]|jgi:uncharacterized membrane protein|nr:DUF2306 domain-containing protein [Alphaproteobacteria bacterium]